MASKLRSFLKNENRDFNNILDSIVTQADTNNTVAGIINNSVTVSNATSADVDLSSITSDHKLYLTGAFAADVILPQATAANAGMRIDVFCTTATAAI